MKHIVLLGDSIFDNAGYVDAGDSVIDCLQVLLPPDYKATLLAVDGDITDDVYSQLDKLPTDTTYVFLSIGGNDALRIINVLNKSIPTVGDAMHVFSEIREGFTNKYKELISAIHNKVDKLFICTIHDSIPDFEQRALTALAFYNEIILKQAIAKSLPILDLRILCNERKDYSPVSPIEPSKFGAKKIADSIYTIVLQHDFSHVNSVIYS
jgi:lysophospholipase L1-like esterase